MQEPDPSDPYSRVNYRRLIAWPARIRREWPFLSEQLEGAPARSVIDLGCGTGEHVLSLGEKGYRAVGIDRSKAMLETARSTQVTEGVEVEFLEGEVQEVDRVVSGRFGAALCLGNMLPHLVEEDDLSRTCEALARVLLPGGLWIAQILNYEGILGRGERALPINFREGDHAGEEIVFLRLMRREDRGRITFAPTTLRWTAGAEPPVEVVTSREVELRAWSQADLRDLLDAAGFAEVHWFGDMVGGAYEPRESRDLVFVARLKA